MAASDPALPESLLALAEGLLRIPSPTGQEDAIGEFLARRLAALAPHALVRAGANLLVVPRAPRPGARRILLLGHLDTVPALGENPVRREGDRLHGLGASDMKAALALMVGLVEWSLRAAPRHDLTCGFYAAEEGPYAASGLPLLRAAAEEWFAGVDLAVCLEPTDNAIELGCLGNVHARVHFAGRRAHSARPWQGENAIHRAGGLLQRLGSRAPVDHRFGPLLYREVMSATMVEYRGARNVVPDRCTVNVNYRFAPGKDEAEVRRDLDGVIAGEAGYELVDFCPAGRVAAGNPLVEELRVAAGGAEFRAKQAWTDVGRLSAWGIDAVNFGPGLTAQAHQAGEYASIAELGRGWAALLRWLHS